MQLKTMMLTLVAIGALAAVADPRVFYVDSVKAAGLGLLLLLR